MGKQHAYEGKSIRVLFDGERCIHAAECVRGLSTVFNAKNKPWIQPDAAEADDIAAVVCKCPTGALSYERLDDGDSEAMPTENSVAIVADGPLHVRGDIQVVDQYGKVIVEGTRLALCRCGASKIKPFCDNSHGDAEFVATGEIPDPKIREVESDSRKLRVVVADNGPLILDGPVAVFDAAGSDRCTGNKTALCRCGASANKPFCDGAHSKIGFSSAT